MSGNKSFDTKVPESESQDSGYLEQLSGLLSEPLSGSLSGPLSRPLPDENVKKESDSKVISVSSEQEALDSGLDLGISEQLSSLSFKDFTPTAEPTLLVDLSEPKPKIPPQLDRLFMQDDDGDTQLHIASVHGCQKSVSTLIRVCPQKAWMDVSNDYGHTALHLAVMSGHSVITRMLVLAGASLDVRDVAGRTPIHLAVEFSNELCIKSLVMPSPNNTREKMVRILNMRDYKGQTCIHYAARAGRFDIIHLLVSFGADILAGEGLAGWTALHLAARAGDAALARAILGKWGAAARARDFAGRSARRLAARSAAAPAFAALAAVADSDSDADSDDDYDSDSDEKERLFEKLTQLHNPINVA